MYVLSGSLCTLKYTIYYCKNNQHNYNLYRGVCAVDVCGIYQASYH